MAALPPELEPSQLLGLALPGDLTLTESRAFIESGELFASIRALTRHPERVRLRFLDDRGRELPGTLTIDEFRDLARRRLARLTIDDGEGGVPVDA